MYTWNNCWATSVWKINGYMYELPFLEEKFSLLCLQWSCLLLLYKHCLTYTFFQSILQTKPHIYQCIMEEFHSKVYTHIYSTKMYLHAIILLSSLVFFLSKWKNKSISQLHKYQLSSAVWNKQNNHAWQQINYISKWTHHEDNSP